MNRTILLAFPLTAALALGACNKQPAGDAPAAREGQSATAAASANGNVRASASGINLKAENFDIDGVALYPGSIIKTMNVDIGDNAGKKVSTVKAAFESPTDAKTLADWFDAEMKKEKFTFTRSGYTLTGTTDDGNAFTLNISDLGGGKANGQVVISDKD